MRSGNSHWMNQALQMPLFSRILSLHNNLRPLKDFHFGDTIFPLRRNTNITSINIRCHFIHTVNINNINELKCAIIYLYLRLRHKGWDAMAKSSLFTLLALYKHDFLHPAGTLNCVCSRNNFISLMQRHSCPSAHILMALYTIYWWL